jgi:hypothetical protein
MITSRRCEEPGFRDVRVGVEAGRFPSRTAKMAGIASEHPTVAKDADGKQIPEFVRFFL